MRMDRTPRSRVRPRLTGRLAPVTAAGRPRLSVTNAVSHIFANVKGVSGPVGVRHGTSRQVAH